MKRSGLGNKFKVSAEEGSWRSGMGVERNDRRWPGTRALKPETTLALGSYTAQVDRTFCPASLECTSIHKRRDWFEKGDAKN